MVVPLGGGPGIPWDSGPSSASLLGSWHSAKVVVEFISAPLPGASRQDDPEANRLDRMETADLTRMKRAGKFEKLLRSDPERWFGWCRVCLLFENSIVCQVC